jgi:hypothetical protein
VTATRLAASSSGGGSGLPGGWISVKDTPYSALGDGTTDDATAIQAAITYVKTNGGVCYFPPGTYKVGTTLNADQNSKGFALVGPEQGAQYQSSAATLVYSGADNTQGTGGLLTLNSSYGWKLANLGFDYTNASFTGHLVQVDGGVHASDVQDFHITHCTSRARTSNTATSIIRMHKAVIGTIDYCHLTGADYCVQYSDLTSSSYVVAVVLEKSTFNFARTADVGLFSGDAETLTFRDLTFEAGVNTTAIKGSAGTRLYKCLFEGFWCGDASGTVIWIDGLANQSNSHVSTIRDCMFFLAGTTSDVAFKMGAVDASNNCGTWLIEGNSVLGSGNAFDSYTPANYRKVIAIANTYQSLTNVWKSGTAYPTTYVSLGNDGEADSLGRLGLTGLTNSPNVEATVNAAETLTLAGGSGAATNAFAALPGTNRSAVYSHFGTSFVPRLVLQAANQSGSEVVLGAGTAPAKTVWVKDAKLGFYDTTPQARTAAYTLNAGATARNLPAAGTVLQVESVLRQLITDLQANGLLQ